MTDNLFIIFLSFTIILIIYGTSVHINPLISIPKTLLGRHTGDFLHRTVLTQIAGAALALLTYHFLIKTNLTQKHTLDRI